MPALAAFEFLSKTFCDELITSSDIRSGSKEMEISLEEISVYFNAKPFSFLVMANATKEMLAETVQNQIKVTRSTIQLKKY